MDGIARSVVGGEGVVDAVSGSRVHIGGRCGGHGVCGWEMRIRVRGQAKTRDKGCRGVRSVVYMRSRRKLGAKRECRRGVGHGVILEGETRGWRTDANRLGRSTVENA